MLKSISQLPPSKAEEAISHASRFLLPTIDEEGSSVPTGTSAQILDEARQRLRISANDASPASIGRIQEVLSQELLSIALPDEKRRRAKRRLGERGYLSPAMYDLYFPPSFKDLFEKLGVRTAHITDALKHPDSVEHLSPHNPGDTSTPHFSLYIKNVRPANGSSFVWLIETERDGYRQQVHSAWRAYDSDVATIGTDRPRELFSRFLEKFGIPFHIGHSGVTNFVFYETFPDPPGFFMGSLNSNVKLFTQAIIRPMPGKVDVAMAYAVNIDLYAASLAKHGVFTSF